MSAETAFVLDASVTLAWCFADEGGDVAEEALNSLAAASALVPSIWPLEVGNGLLGAERRGRLSKAESARLLEMLRQLPIVVEATVPERALAEVLSLARLQGLSTYDACYLDLAMRLGLPIVTLDGPLRHAATRCGVPLRHELPR